MGVCSSEQRDEGNIDGRNNPETTDCVDYQQQPVIDSNANYVDTRLRSVGDKVFMTGPSNDISNIPGASHVVNGVYQSQPGVPTEVVYQEVNPREAMLSSNVVYQDNGIGTMTYTTELGAAYVVNNAYRPGTAAFEVGDHNNDFQGSDAYQRGSGRVITNTVPQNSHLLQNGAGVALNPVIQNPIDEQTQQVYETKIGSEVYLTQANEQVDGLERVTEPETVLNERKEQQEQPMYGVEQTGVVDGDNVGNPQGGNNNVERIENYQVGVVAKTELSNSGNQNDETQTANQSTNEKPGMTVYDQLIGQMVTILDENAPVDGMEELIIPIVNYGNIPHQEHWQAVQQNGRFAV